MRFFITYCVIFFLQATQHSQCYYELVEELGCHSEDFRLHCPPLDGQILILEATFTENDSFLTPFNSSCGFAPNRTGQSPVNFRHAINKRCSGKNLCSFSLLDDHPEAVRWGPGAIYLRYACMDETNILKTCRAEVAIAGEGFIQTPGYPRYYVGGHPCSWTLRAPPHKKVQVEFLDIALRGVAPLEKACLDQLQVTEHGLDMLATCGDDRDPQIITSVGPELNVTLTTASTNIFPKRGLLFHYKGCDPPEPPQDGYVVTHNTSTVHFQCNVGYVFPDSASRDRVINCDYPDIDFPVPSCVYVGSGNTTGGEADVPKMNLTVGVIAPKEADGSMVSDILVPCLIVGILFCANGVILAAIYFYKRRLLSGGPDSWENTIVENGEKEAEEK